MLTIAAWGFALCCAVVITFHLAMVAGAPWGHLTMGGKYPGRLEGRVRLLPLAAAAILTALALIVLDRAGQIALGLPSVAFILAGVVTVLTTLANLATPSKPERALWGPVTVVMALAYGVVAALT